MNWQYIMLHHTGPPTNIHTSPDSIRRYHIAKGWRDVGYHFLADYTGTIHKGRPLTMPGAHEERFNRTAIGIACIGNFDVEPFPPAMQEALVALVVDLMRQYGIPPENILLHRDVDNTACPGRNFPEKEIKEKARMLMQFKDLDQCMYPDLMLEAVRMGLVAGVKRPDGLYLEPKRPVTREESILIDLRQHKILDHLMDIPEMVKKYMPSVVRIYSKGEKYQSVGSGSFVAPNIILTNAHVVGDNAVVSVDTHDYHPDNNKMQGRVIKKDTGIDLALVQIDLKYTPLKLADSAVHGEFCLVLGNPGGEFQSVTLGIVAHPDRGDYIETDARINPGNSGGAVINERGELIGVPSHKIAFDHSWDNQNYAIRVERVKAFIAGVV